MAPTKSETTNSKKGASTRKAKATGTVELKVVNASGKEVGTRKVSAEIFAAAINRTLLHEVVRWQRAKARAGTHSTQTRAEMTGGGAKPWKQKGTGRARAGSNTSPLWVGGGIAHGPKPRSYEFSLNKKERRAALCGALTARAQEGKVVLLEDFALKGIKTKEAQTVLKAIGVPARSKAVVVVGEQEDTAQKSLRNLEKVVTVKPRGLNVYAILNAKVVVFTGKALDGVEARLNTEE